MCGHSRYNRNLGFCIFPSSLTPFSPKGEYENSAIKNYRNPVFLNHKKSSKRKKRAQEIKGKGRKLSISVAGRQRPWFPNTRYGKWSTGKKKRKEKLPVSALNGETIYGTASVFCNIFLKFTYVLIFLLSGHRIVTHAFP